ncbi:LysR family transcriptional regulator [Bordetella ansorpii]|uniref:LysR family transcriptional regulator n=1 Tax=Bordetella ansorpii TaxID=288768 RepID=A0A157P3A6_9BORD|nr:LysR family transcriptional regulator [Bordetella ansorpii]SAI28023.1 LysR family transcriptional regulator [Bordetella ansorpii]
MRSINLANLETAFWIARLGSFTAAAQRLYTTQPAISARIRELEAALGVKLFVRVGRGVEMTIEGRQFLEEAEPIFQQLDSLAESVRADKASGGTVRIGAGNISMVWFPALVRDLQAARPDLIFDVEIDIASKLLQKLEARKLDVALVAGSVRSDKLIARTLGFDRMLWVASRDYLQNNWRGNLLDFLKRSPIWCVQKDSFYWTDAMRTLVEGGADTRQFNGISNMAAARQIVLSNCGIGCLSEAMILQDLQSGVLQPVPDLHQGGWVEFFVVCCADPARSRLVDQIMDIAPKASTLRRTTD